MKCPACEQPADFGHVCRLATSTEERLEELEEKVKALSACYDALKTETAAVYGVVGGEPGDSPSQAAAKALAEARAGVLQEVLAKLHKEAGNLRLERKELRQSLKEAKQHEDSDPGAIDLELSYQEGRHDTIQWVIGALEAIQ
jgi:uncharacterized protein YlxW (UPF0749 family)